MELITAIALLCQISIGVGTGNTYYNAHEAFKTSLKQTAEEQKSCQQKLAGCILKKDDKEIAFRISTALKCIKER